jgi:hypothetical protein
MTHMDICNTRYGKKKGRESNWQGCRWSATHRCKDCDESYNIASEVIPIEGLSKKL